MIRVVVTGSECTGKTTLAEELARELRTVMVPEFARRFVVDAGRSPTVGDVESIARGQLAAEEAAATKARRVLVLDTDLLSTVIYSRHYYGGCPGWIEEEASRRAGDLYLLADIDVPWRPDGVRDRGHRREEMQRLFRDELERRRLRFVDVTGDPRRRLAGACAAVDAVLRTRPERSGPGGPLA